MAILRSIFPFRGSIGNVRAYVVAGSPDIILSNKGGPSKTQVDTLPSLELTRQNNVEFRGVAAAVAFLYSGIAASQSNYFDSQLSARLVALVKKVQLNDFEGLRGKRQILFSGSRPLFADVRWNVRKTLSSVFAGHIVALGNFPYDNMTLNVAIPSMSSMFNFKKGATHVRFRQVIRNVVDFTYSDVTKLYSPAVPALFVTVETAGPWLAKTGVGSFNQVVDTALPYNARPSEEFTLLQFVIVEYAVLANNVYYPTSNFGIALVGIA